jgi:hypothetical protein
MTDRRLGEIIVDDGARRGVDEYLSKPDKSPLSGASIILAVWHSSHLPETIE